LLGINIKYKQNLTNFDFTAKKFILQLKIRLIKYGTKFSGSFKKPRTVDYNEKITVDYNEKININTIAN